MLAEPFPFDASLPRSTARPNPYLSTPPSDPAWSRAKRESEARAQGGGAQMRTKRGNRRVKQDAQNRREHCWCRKRWLQSQQKYPHPPSEKGRGAAEVQVTKSVNHPRGPPGSLERQAQWEIQGEHPDVETKIGGHLSLNAIFKPEGLRSTRGRRAAHNDTSIQRGIEVPKPRRTWR